MKPASLGLVLCWLILAAGARAEMSAAEVMARMDEAMTKAQDQFLVYEIITKEPGKSESRLRFQVHIKGTKWRRLEFTDPGDVKGMRFLVRSLTQMYVYLPAYKRVRRVASHVRDQGFMGTAYSYDEMAIVTYGVAFTGELTGETETRWNMKCTRKPGKTYRYLYPPSGGTDAETRFHSWRISSGK